MGIIDKAEETVTSTTPHVIEALGRIKFLLVGIPVICVVVGIVSQQVLPERNVAMATFKLGTFATPDSPEPVPLAGEAQMKARLRANASILREDYPDALLITTILDNDVVTPTVSALGPEVTKGFLRVVIQKEIDFQNGRLEKLQAVQTERRNSLEEQLDDLVKRTAALSASQKAGGEAVALLALQQEIDNARARTTVIRKELDTMSLLNASDLFIDTTQIVRPPYVVASSNWYRPVMFGAAGLAVGLILMFVLAIIAIVRALTRKKDAQPIPGD